VSNPTAVLFCPGRGSYGKDELGFLTRTLRKGPVADALKASDARRREQQKTPISELDGAEQYRPGVHGDGQNAAELIYFSTLAHTELLRSKYRIIAVAGNSLGWYTALSASQALDPTSGFRLVATMAELQKQNAGGQILTTTLGEDWLADATRYNGIDAALEKVNALGADFFCTRSIRLGGHEVLAGTEAAIKQLLVALPKIRLGDRDYPFRLAGHGPFHTKLCETAARQAAMTLAGIPMREPQCHLIDGFGNVHSPWSADPARLFDYTTNAQVIETYDFSAVVRTALREFNPDVLLCAGPGKSLRAPVGHVVLREGWRNLRDKQALFASPVIASD
jgi:acyl transferase domain-containing protein